MNLWEISLCFRTEVVPRAIRGCRQCSARLGPTAFYDKGDYLCQACAGERAERIRRKYRKELKP